MIVYVLRYLLVIMTSCYSLRHLIIFYDFLYLYYNIMLIIMTFNYYLWYSITFYNFMCMYYNILMVHDFPLFSMIFYWLIAIGCHNE